MRAASCLWLTFPFPLFIHKTHYILYREYKAFCVWIREDPVVYYPSTTLLHSQNTLYVFSCSVTFSQHYGLVLIELLCCSEIFAPSYPRCISQQRLLPMRLAPSMFWVTVDMLYLRSHHTLDRVRKVHIFRDHSSHFCFLLMKVRRSG